MKPLVLLGSLRKGAYGETLVQKIAEGVEQGGWSTGYIRLNDLSVRSCLGCWGAIKTGNCVVNFLLLTESKNLNYFSMLHKKA